MEDISDSPSGRCEVLPVSQDQQRRTAEPAVLAGWVLLFARWFTVQLVSSVNSKAELDKKATGERKTNLKICGKGCYGGAPVQLFNRAYALKGCGCYDDMNNRANAKLALALFLNEHAYVFKRYKKCGGSVFEMLPLMVRLKNTV
ncbi:hypothetical protein TTRE_0000016001 [Trichuris trichiura]|uniref:Uncharacterized protein n=1 Tax=Trichuris trichiura TaxID=36087 RepID=A0A077YVT7_TRITR|nr:hypothetical protein TTRE_0000016001 [Trichuris trichiura]